MCSWWIPNYLETISLRALPALKEGSLEDGISIFSLVLGLMPSLAARSFTSKVPKPTSATFSPAASASEIASITAAGDLNAAAGAACAGANEHQQHQDGTAGLRPQVKVDGRKSGGGDDRRHLKA